MRLILLKILFLSLFTCFVSKEAECVRQLNKADALKVSRTVQLFVSKQAGTFYSIHNSLGVSRRQICCSPDCFVSCKSFLRITLMYFLGDPPFHHSHLTPYIHFRVCYVEQYWLSGESIHLWVCLYSDVG